MESFFHLQLQFTRMFTKKLNEQLSHVGIYQSQWSIIYYLYLYGESSLVEISNYYEVEKPTITRTVNRLEERELIEKVPSLDKRERRIQLTEKGKDIYIEVKEIVDAFEENLVAGIPKEKMEATLHTIELLINNLKDGGTRFE